MNPLIAIWQWLVGIQDRLRAVGAAFIFEAVETLRWLQRPL